jgi:hypothetical protein
VETLSSSISSAQIDPEQLDIPGWVPESTYMWAIDGINSMIGSVASGIDSVNSSVIPVIDSFVEEQTAWAQGQLDSISLAVAEGGEVDTLLQGSFQMVQDGISMMMEQFAEWEPVLDLGFTEAVASLRSAATSVEDSSYSSRVDDFKNFLQTDAQAQVDSWKAEHKESVETAYYMPVLDEDISAVEQAWGILDPKLNEAVSDNQLPFRTYQSALVAVAEAKAQKGKKGQEALNKVWGAGDMLASIAGRLGV